MPFPYLSAPPRSEIGINLVESGAAIDVTSFNAALRSEIGILLNGAKDWQQYSFNAALRSEIGIRTGAGIEAGVFEFQCRVTQRNRNHENIDIEKSPKTGVSMPRYAAK